MRETPGKSRLHKLKWFLAGLFILLAAMFAAPFLSSTLFARIALVYFFPAHTPSLGSATLSPEGKLILYDLVFNDTTASKQQRLLTIHKVEAVFDWTALLLRQIHQIRAEEVTVYICLTNPSPLALLELFVPHSSSVPIAESQRSTLPLWIDTLNIQGLVHLEGGKGFTPITAKWPLTLQMTTSGDRLQPVRRFRVAVGMVRAIQKRTLKSRAGAAPAPSAEDAFGLWADFDTQPAAGDTRVEVRRLAVGAVTLMIATEVLRPYVPKLPVELSGPLSTNFELLDISGQINVEPGGEMGFSGQLRLQDLTVRWSLGENSAIVLDRLTVAGHVVSRLDRWTPATLQVRQGTLHWAALSYGTQAVDNLETAWSIDGQKLITERSVAQLFDGHIRGSLTWDVTTHAIPQCDFQLTSMNMHKVLANLSPQHLDAEGHASGVLHLSRSSEGTLAGSVELTFDEPGILRVGEVAEVRQMLIGNVGLNLANLAMSDLQQYPFKAGKVDLESIDENSQLKINFVRQHSRPTKATSPHQETLNGQEVEVRSLVVPTIDVTIPIRGTSFAAILSLISGVRPLIENSRE
jgi:hypothetical protein